MTIQESHIQDFDKVVELDRHIVGHLLIITSLHFSEKYNLFAMQYEITNMNENTIIMDDVVDISISFGKTLLKLQGI